MATATSDTDHIHCPRGCEHPQEFEREGKWYCGRCCYESRWTLLIEMVLCTPQTCPELQKAAGDTSA